MEYKFLDGDGSRAAMLENWRPGGPSDAIVIEVLNQLRTGVIVVDCAGSPLFLNSAARDIVSQADGLRIDAEGLLASDLAATRALRKMIAMIVSAARAPNALAARLERPSKRWPLDVRVAPLPRRAASPKIGEPAAILYVNDPEAHAVSLLRLYGLTHAEATVARGIASGLGLKRVATMLGIAQSTARTHLQRAFDKTGTHRQAELAWLMAKSAAGLLAHGVFSSKSQRQHQEMLAA